MKTVKFTASISAEFSVDIENYPDNVTPEEALQIELDALGDLGPDYFVNMECDGEIKNLRIE